MGFTLSLRCSSSVRVASGAAVFTLLLHRRIAFLQHTATCQPFSKPQVSFLPTYKTIGVVFRIFIALESFRLTLPCKYDDLTAKK
jgi:hypothetical protein